jgi:hypothetical protein
MLRPVMAALAELWRLPGQKLGVVAAVRLMACQTVLCNRRVLPHERTSLVCMTFIAEFIDSVRLELFVAKGPVNVVTACAGNQPLFDRMMRLPVRLRPDVFMTLETDVGLSDLH